MLQGEIHFVVLKLCPLLAVLLSLKVALRGTSGAEENSSVVGLGALSVSLCIHSGLLNRRA